MKHRSFKVSSLSLAAFLATLGSIHPAVGAPVLTSFSMATTANPPVAGSTLINNASTAYSSSRSDASGPGASVSAGRSVGWVNTNGAYYVGADAAGVAFGRASTGYTNNFVNNSGVTQRFSLSFHIYGGSISTALAFGQSLTGSENLLASYSASLKVNGNLKFSSSASVRQTAGGIVVNKTGVDLNSSDNGLDGDFSWSGAYYNLDLGEFAAGASIDIFAEVADQAFADVGTYSFSSPGREYGYDGCYTVGGCPGVNVLRNKGLARAGYGDPIQLSGQPGAVLPPGGSRDPTGTNVVSEPGSLILAGLGLAGAGLARRRRNLA